MIVIDVDPVIFQGGPLALRWYGVMYVVGILVGLRVAMPYARSIGLDEDTAWAVFAPALIGGLLGGRLYYVVQSGLGDYLRQPWRILATWEGGMAFYGAVFGATAAIAYVAWRRKLSREALGKLLDSAALFARGAGVRADREHHQRGHPGAPHRPPLGGDLRAPRHLRPRSGASPITPPRCTSCCSTCS